MKADLFEQPSGARYMLSKTKSHFSSVAKAIGISRDAQTRAINKGGTHDYKLSQLERIALAKGVTFRQLMFQSLVTKEEYERISKCFNI